MPRQSGPTLGRPGHRSWPASRQHGRSSAPAWGYLPGVDHGYRQPGGNQFPCQGHFHSAGSLQHHQLGHQFLQMLHHLADALGIMGDLPHLTGGTHRHIQALLGDIYANKQLDFLHSAPPCKCSPTLAQPCLIPNPPMGGVNAGQIGMREPAREKAWAPLDRCDPARVFSSRTGPGERSMEAGNRVIVRSDAAGCTRGRGGREFGGVGAVADSAVRRGVEWLAAGPGRC